MPIVAVYLWNIRYESIASKDQYGGTFLNFIDMIFTHPVPLLTIRNISKQLQLPLREYMQSQEGRKGGPYCHENVNLKNKQILTKSKQMRRGNTSSGWTSGRNHIGLFEWFATATGWLVGGPHASDIPGICWCERTSIQGSKAPKYQNMHSPAVTWLSQWNDTLLLMALHNQRLLSSFDDNTVLQFLSVCFACQVCFQIENIHYFGIVFLHCHLLGSQEISASGCSVRPILDATIFPKQLCCLGQKMEIACEDQLLWWRQGSQVQARVSKVDPQGGDSCGISNIFQSCQWLQWFCQLPIIIKWQEEWGLKPSADTRAVNPVSENMLHPTLQGPLHTIQSWFSSHVFLVRIWALQELMFLWDAPGKYIFIQSDLWAVSSLLSIPCYCRTWKRIGYTKSPKGL